MSISNYIKLEAIVKTKILVFILTMPFFAVMLFLAAVMLLSGCAPEKTKTWTPSAIDPGLHLFYMSPVTEAVSVRPGRVFSRFSRIRRAGCSAPYFHLIYFLMAVAEV